MNKPEKKPLSTQERRFVLAYTAIGTPTCSQLGKSAKEAGFDNNPSQQANRLMKKPHIQAAIRDIHDKMMSKAAINPQRILSDLENTKNLALAKGDLVSANQAIKLQGSYLMMFGAKIAIDDTKEVEQQEGRMLLSSQVHSEFLLMHMPLLDAEVERRETDPHWEQHKSFQPLRKIIESTLIKEKVNE